MIKTRRLLVIDQNRETGEVLKAVLERRQTEVMSIRRWEDLPSLEPPSAATVLVLRGPEALVNHPEADRLGQLPRVVIGRVAAGRLPRLSFRRRQPRTHSGSGNLGARIHGKEHSGPDGRGMLLRRYFRVSRTSECH
ncbi:MAG: hypothetical protein R3C12_09925 [Planctomycetaceae bacterium]